MEEGDGIVEDLCVCHLHHGHVDDGRHRNACGKQQPQVRNRKRGEVCDEHRGAGVCPGGVCRVSAGSDR